MAKYDDDYEAFNIQNKRGRERVRNSCHMRLPFSIIGFTCNFRFAPVFIRSSNRSKESKKRKENIRRAIVEGLNFHAFYRGLPKRE